MSPEVPLPQAAEAAAAAWPGPCRGFWRSWAALSADGAIPSSERFLDAMPARFLSNTYIVELTAEMMRVRFQGTGLVDRWRIDFTGGEMLAHQSQKMRDSMRRVMSTMGAHPCGYYALSRYLSSLERPLESHVVRLPLAVQAGRPPRTATFSLQTEPLDLQESVILAFETVENAWLDIGHGVPARPPGPIKA